MKNIPFFEATTSKVFLACYTMAYSMITFFSTYTALQTDGRDATSQYSAKLNCTIE